MTKVAVSTPRCGPCAWPYHDSMMQFALSNYRTNPEIELATLHPERYLPIDVARNLLVSQFLKTDADYMWFVDQDCSFVPGTLARLLSRRMPIVSALEMMRLPGVCYPMALKGKIAPGSEDYRIQATEVYEWAAQWYDCTTNAPQMLEIAPQDSLLEVGFTGCHCLLIRRDVLEEMEPPHFQGYNPGGEDQWFCERAFAMGIPTYVDMSVLVGHATTDRVIGLLDFMAGHRFISEKKHLEEQEQMEKLREWSSA